MEDSRRVTAYFLHKHLTSHVIWPNTGTLTPYDIPALDHSELLLSSTALTTHTDKGFGQLLRYDHARYTVTPYDSTLSTALAATGQNLSLIHISEPTSRRQRQMCIRDSC